MQTEILIDRVRQMRDATAEEIEGLERERRVAEHEIARVQTTLQDIDREIAVKREIIAEYQELIRRLENQ
jgi:septal ring factor EnvC (AmiA/AmiB activator)